MVHFKPHLSYSEFCGLLGHGFQKSEQTVPLNYSEMCACGKNYLPTRSVFNNSDILNHHFQSNFSKNSNKLQNEKYNRISTKKFQSSVKADLGFVIAHPRKLDQVLTFPTTKSHKRFLFTPLQRRTAQIKNFPSAPKSQMQFGVSGIHNVMQDMGDLLLPHPCFWHALPRRPPLPTGTLATISHGTPASRSPPPGRVRI